jgi:hypothetical protein
MKHSRHGFSKKTIEVLSKRVAFRCSNPDCQKLTVAASSENNLSSTTIGIAAHIKAASPGGARYDVTMTPQERASIENGLWLCIACSTIIDKEPSSYPVHLLNQWKYETEKAIRKEFEKAFNQIDQLKKIQRDSVFSQDIFVRKHFSIGELLELLRTIGFTPLIRELSNRGKNDPFSNELINYGAYEYPKLLSFSVEEDRKVNYGLALITKIECEQSRIITLSETTKSKLKVQAISTMFIEHDKIPYSIPNFRISKTPLQVRSQSQETLTDKSIIPQHFIIANPSKLKVDFFDVSSELLAIDFIFHLFLGLSDLTWEINLKDTKHLSRSLKSKFNSPLIWVITGNALDHEFIDFYFYSDENDIVKIIPKTSHKVIRDTLKEIIMHNIDDFKNLNFESLLIDYYKKKS